METFSAAFGGGLAAGLMVLVIEQIRHSRSKPHLKVSGTARFLLQDLNEKLVLQASNDRHLPVSIYGIGLELHHPSRVSKWFSSIKERPWGRNLQPASGFGTTENDLAFSDFKPTEIKPGGKFVYPVNIQDVVAELKQMGKNPRDLKSRCVTFSAGANSFRGTLDRHGRKKLEEGFCGNRT